jgi:hypothetical protein
MTVADDIAITRFNASANYGDCTSIFMPLNPFQRQSNSLSRRQFLGMLGAASLTRPMLALGYDWEEETALVKQVRETLENIFAGHTMALDFRAINSQLDEEFRIQINALDIYPVASCFKAFVAFYYYLNTPLVDWQDSEGTSLYSMAVFSNNVETGTVLLDVANRVRGTANAIEKFNNFLRLKLDIYNGLYTWDWPGTPTAGLFDTRYADQTMSVHGQSYPVINAITANDLGRGYDILTRGDSFTVFPEIRDAIQATRALLSIPAADYRSPIERVYPPGYMGKDGVLPTGDIAVGRVLDDAGVIRFNNTSYMISFLSAGESESVVLNVLGQVIQQIGLYESAR